MTEKNNHTGLKVGLGLAAITAAGSAYYLLGKDGKKRRARAAAWVDQAKKDIAKKVETVKEMSQEIYNETVDKALTKYKKFQKENPEEFAKLVAELKGHWQYIKDHLAVQAKSGGKTPAKKKTVSAKKVTTLVKK